MAEVVSSSSSSSGARSKYDFVKVRIWLNDHFYVLSRYLLCRALVATEIDSNDAVQISLELKKTLVDLQLLDIVQEQFEDYLYKTMLMLGYNATHISRYRMMTTFHQKRVPLIIFLAGTACIGKSTIASKLAERMNLSSVLQTDVVFEMICCLGDHATKALDSTLEYPTDSDLLKDYSLECQKLKQAIDADIVKCLKEGKSIVVEGFHVNPRLFDSVQQLLHEQYHSYGIILPFVLQLDATQHEAFFKYSADPKYQEFKHVQLHNFQRIQQCLVDQAKSCGFHILPMNLHSFNETIDTLQAIILRRIEEQYVEGKW